MSLIERIPGPGKAQVGEAEYVFKLDSNKRAVARVGNITDEMCLLARADYYRRVDDSGTASGGGGGSGGGVKSYERAAATRKSGAQQAG